MFLFKFKSFVLSKTWWYKQKILNQLLFLITYKFVFGKKLNEKEFRNKSTFYFYLIFFFILPYNNYYLPIFQVHCWDRVPLHWKLKKNKKKGEWYEKPQTHMIKLYILKTFYLCLYAFYALFLLQFCLLFLTISIVCPIIFIFWVI